MLKNRYLTRYIVGDIKGKMVFVGGTHFRSLIMQVGKNRDL